VPVTSDIDNPTDARQLRAAGERIEALVEASAAAGPAARARAEDLVGCVTELYGAGLERTLRILDGLGVLDDRVVNALAADELVAGLLLVHDLHPYDLQTRVDRALDSVRPYLGSHGGDVELLGVDDAGVVRLRMLGSCDGCPSSSVTLQLAVEGAIEAAAPEVTRIDVETSSPAPVAAGRTFSVDSLLSRVGRPSGSPAAAWVEMPQLGMLASGELAGFQIDGLAVCACRIGADIFCYRDQCAHCAASLAGGVLERRLGDPVGGAILRCPRCHSHFDLRHAGACLDQVGEHLDPLPLLAAGAMVSVAVPATS
jgi:Fe-S cluster biogenesis protein NfuA/nitrite reductase/ring-hydroxylating ferredoxin subunit